MIKKQDIKQLRQVLMLENLPLLNLRLLDLVDTKVSAAATPKTSPVKKESYDLVLDYLLSLKGTQRP